MTLVVTLDENSTPEVGPSSEQLFKKSSAVYFDAIVGEHHNKDFSKNSDEIP